VLLKNSEGKYLLLRRSPKKYPEVGPKWGIVGGRIEPGTTLMENLRREIKEEVCLDFTVESRLVAAQDILRVPGQHVVRLTYVGEIDWEPKLDNDHQERKWFAAEEIRRMRGEVLDLLFKELVDEQIIIL